MMKRNYYYTYLLLAIAMVAGACEDIIDVDLRGVEPKLVIEGTVRMDAPAEVRITRTKDFGSSNEYIPVTDAVVTIKDDAGHTEQLTPGTSGNYLAQTIRGVQQRTYNLTVTYESKEYTATTYMPPAVEIDSLTLFKFPVTDYPYPMVHFADPAGPENQYYRYIVYVNDERPDTREKLISTEFVDGTVVRQPIFVRSRDGIEEDAIQQGDLITVEMQCIDRGVYTFFNTLSMVENSLANPTSNIQGGALGYFGAYSFTSKKIKAEWDW